MQDPGWLRVVVAFPLRLVMMGGVTGPAAGTDDDHRTGQGPKGDLARVLERLRPPRRASRLWDDELASDDNREMWGRASWQRNR